MVQPLFAHVIYSYNNIAAPPSALCFEFRCESQLVLLGVPCGAARIRTASNLSACFDFRSTACGTHVTVGPDDCSRVVRLFLGLRSPPPPPLNHFFHAISLSSGSHLSGCPELLRWDQMRSHDTIRVRPPAIVTSRSETPPD